MHGFTLGVAFIISANQLNFLLGIPPLKRHPEFLLNLGETFANVGKARITAVLFFSISLAVLMTLVKKNGKMPWAILLAIAGIIVGFIQTQTGTNEIKTLGDPDRYQNLVVTLFQALDTSKIQMTLPVAMDLARGTLSITAVAVLETLISARIADRMTKTLFDQQREVLSVGLSNVASGIMGGIPATAALARTALNVKTGATSRGAGIVNALSIALLSSVFFSTFKFLPLPIVATILVNTAYRMVEWHEVNLLIDTDRPMAIVMFVTAIISIIEDPTAGIIYGSFFAMMRSASSPRACARARDLHAISPPPPVPYMHTVSPPISALLAMMHGHAFLSIYTGTQRVLHEEFTLNDGVASVKAVRARFSGEIDEAADAMAREHHVASSTDGAVLASSTIAATASAMKIAEIDRKAAETRVAAFKSMLTAGSAYPGIDALPSDVELPRVAVYDMPGYASYVGAKSHLDRVRGLFVDVNTRLPGIDVVAFSLKECKFIDPDAFEAIGDVVNVRGRVGERAYHPPFSFRITPPPFLSPSRCRKCPAWVRRCSY